MLAGREDLPYMRARLTTEALSRCSPKASMKCLMNRNIDDKLNNLINKGKIFNKCLKIRVSETKSQIY